MRRPPRPIAMPAHGEARGTERDASGIHLDGGARGSRMLTPAGIEGNDGRDGFGLEKVVDAVRIEATIVDDGPHGDGQCVGGTGLEEAVQTGWPHGEIRDMARGEPDDARAAYALG